MSRDIALGTTGSPVEIEQETPAGNLPVAGSEAIAANGGRVGKIESLTRGRTIASYQTTIKSKEVAFSPQGVPVNVD
jgi:hypothetical protein